MATASLNNQINEVAEGKDSIVIINALAHIPGGRTLDVSGVDSSVKVLNAGHVIIKTAAGEYKPLGITTNAYNSLDTGESYVGVLKTSILVSDPRASILTQGQVNAAASPYEVTDTIKAGLPLIEFLY